MLLQKRIEALASFFFSSCLRLHHFLRFVIISPAFLSSSSSSSFLLRSSSTASLFFFFLLLHFHRVSSQRFCAPPRHAMPFFDIFRQFIAAARQLMLSFSFASFIISPPPLYLLIDIDVIFSPHCCFCAAAEHYAFSSRADDIALLPPPFAAADPDSGYRSPHDTMAAATPTFFARCRCRCRAIFASGARTARCRAASWRCRARDGSARESARDIR